MKPFIPFLRLIRIGNLLVMGLTMAIIQQFVVAQKFVWIKTLPKPVNLDNASTISSFTNFNKAVFDASFDLNFFLLYLTVFLIAGAGNIINDYFDVKADRVNKPEKLIVGKHIKRRWAIVLNWIFNTIGLGLAVYLSHVNHNYWIAFIAFLTINFLWFYSALYKRKIFIGNFIVAALVGIVPVYVLIYNMPTPPGAIFPSLFSDYVPLLAYEVVVIISLIAFVINLMREIIKDIADIRGDLQLSAKTVPIALGIRSSKIILTLLLVPLLFLMTYYIFGMDQSLRASAFGNMFSLMVIGSALTCIIAFTILLTANNRKKYLLASNLLKVAMLFGIISPLFI